MDISDSLLKVYSSTALLGKVFYDQFFADCPEAIEYFDEVDMKRQAVVVTMALTLVEQYQVSPFAPTKAYFEHLGVTHQRMGIPKQMYPHWVDSMLKALAKLHGDEWDDDLEIQWRKGFETAIGMMLESYQ